MSIKTWKEFYRAGGVSIEQAMELENAELRSALAERNETVEELQALFRAQAHFLNEAHDELNGGKK